MAHSKIPGHGMLHPKSQLHDGFLLKEIPEQDRGVLSPFSPNSVIHKQLPQSWPYSCTIVYFLFLLIIHSMFLLT